MSVVLPTRDRPEHAAASAAAILRDPALLELIVVDQSEGNLTEAKLAALADPRLRYLRSAIRGVTSARNAGIELALGEVIAFTDDDCRVPSDWVARLAAIFERDPQAALVCGRVRVPEDLRKNGFTLGFEPEVREWARRFPPLGHDWGVTANLAVRREVLSQVGVFDPVLGAGAPLLSGGEPDLIFRVIRAGLKVVNAQEVVVDHLGVRAPGRQTHELWRAYASGTGAAIFKHVRLGDPRAMLLYLRFLGSCLGGIVANLVRRRRPLGVGYALSFLSGSLASYRFRVDPTRRLYRPRGAGDR